MQSPQINNRKTQDTTSRQQTQTGHIISHTHWDREWRVPIWHARKRLLKMMDALLQTFRDNRDFKHFVFDGQVVSIEDYLSFRPEKRDEIVNLVQANRLQIGPWYNLPDLYPVCGEALVRNLLIGRRRAEAFGRCLNIAYTTFGWGQTAQMPQIFAGFGIDFVVAGKNVNKERAPHAEFLWQSPDGTEILTTRLGVEKRANFFFFSIMPLCYGVRYESDACQSQWGKNGWYWQAANGDVHSEMTCVPQFKYHKEMLPDALSDAWMTTEDTLVPEHRFMGNGCDSTGPVPFMHQLIQDANALGANRKLQHSGLEEYADCLRQAIRDKGLDLKVVHGELRDGPVEKLSANALATRMYLKTLNRRAQTNLIQHGEPLATLGQLFGLDYPQAFIDEAWQQLLLAHSHDAINGVTLDKTADDTANKLQQVIELGDVVTDMTAAELLQRVDLSAYDSTDILLAVFNPTPRPVRHVVRATVDIPQSYQSRWVKVIDSDGSELPVQPGDRQSLAIPVNIENSRALPFYADRHELHFHTGTIGAYGYKVLRLQPEGTVEQNREFWPGEFEYGTQLTGPQRMANKYVEVTLHGDGTFDVLHRATGRQYKQLHYFEDGGELGDYWYRSRPVHDRVYTTLEKPARIHLKEDGPLVTTFVCEITLEVPAHGDRHTQQRSEQLVPIDIRSEITLRAATPYVDVRTTVENRAKDHRLRVCLPTELACDESIAMGHFNVDRRPIERSYGSDGKRHANMSTLPQQNFVDLNDGTAGLAVLNRNLIEFEVSEDRSRTLALTLLRSVPVRICTEHRCATQDPTQDGGQCLGSHTYEYAIYPHAGDWRQADVYGVMEHYVHVPRLYQMSVHDRGTLPTEMSLFSIEPSELQIAAIKKAQDSAGMVIRLYNPTEQVVTGKLRFGRDPKTACMVNLNEEMQQAIELGPDGAVPLQVAGNRIVTVLCRFS